VPFIVAYLIYSQREILRALPYQGSWAAGLGLLLLSLFFFWVGYKADTAYPGYIAAQLSVASMIVLLGGWCWMRTLFFPWLFLLFMWPMIPLEERVAFPLRMEMANASAILINMIGIPVVRDGTNIISAADSLRGLAQGELFQLDVDAPCSGIRSLFSLLMISALYGWLSLKKVWPRWVLFFAAAPLAMLGNIVRMLILAIGCAWLGPEIAVGKNIGDHQEISAYHEFSGYAVFIVALAGMFALCNLLEKKHLEKKQKQAGTTAIVPTAASSTVMPKLAVAYAITGMALLLFGYISTEAPIAEPGVNMQLPSVICSMPSEEFEMTQRERENLFNDVTISRRNYHSSKGQNFLATAVLSGQVRRSLHRPEVCLPGQGWVISRKEEIPLNLKDGRTLSATLLSLFRDEISQEGERQRLRGMNIFWYVGSAGVTTADYYDHVYQSYFDSVFKNINHRWALLSFFTLYTDNSVFSLDSNAELAAMSEIQSFISEAAAEMMQKP
jgi:exosortase